MLFRSGIAGPILGGMLGDLGSFPLAFSICGGACLVGAACTFLVKPPRLSDGDKPELA